MAVVVIDTIKPKNQGTFPVVEAADVKVTNDKRLDAALNDKASQADVTALQTAVAGKASQADVTALSETVSGKANQSDLTALSNTVSGKASQADLTALSNTVADKADKSALAETNAAVAGKQDTLSESQLAAVDSGITPALVTQIGTNTTAIAGKADAADLTALEAEVDTKADESDLTTATSNLQAQIDNIVGGSTADSEVINARVGADSTSYNTLKARLDAENTDVNNDLTNLNLITMLDEGVSSSESSKSFNVDFTDYSDLDGDTKICIVNNSNSDKWVNVKLYDANDTQLWNTGSKLITANSKSDVRYNGMKQHLANTVKVTVENANNGALHVKMYASYIDTVLDNIKNTNSLTATVNSNYTELKGDFTDVKNDLMNLNINTILDQDVATSETSKNITTDFDSIAGDFRICVTNKSNADKWVTITFYDSENTALWNTGAKLVSANSKIDTKYINAQNYLTTTAKVTVDNPNGGSLNVKFYGSYTTKLLETIDTVDTMSTEFGVVKDTTDMVGTPLKQYFKAAETLDNTYYNYHNQTASANNYRCNKVLNMPAGDYYLYNMSKDFTWIKDRSTGTWYKAGGTYFNLPTISHTQTKVTIPFNFDLYLTTLNNDDCILTNGKIPRNYVEGVYDIALTNAMLNNIKDNSQRIYYCGSTRDYTTLKSVVEEATKYMDSIIYLDAETFDLVQEFGQEWLENYDQDTSCGLYLKNRVHIIGAEGSKIIFNYTGNNRLIHKWFSPFNSAQYGFTLENVRIESTNCRYSVHDERAWSTDAYHNIYKRCSMLHQSDGVDWLTQIALGGGLGVHGDVLIEDGTYEAVGGTYDISYHNSTIDAQTKSKVVVRNAWLKHTTSCANYGTSTEKSEFIINNCSLGAQPFLEKSISPDRADNMVLTKWNNEIRE